MKYVVDPIIFSINIPIFASHILLKIEKFSYKEFRYLIKRMANSLYFPYYIERDRDLQIIFISFIHKYSMYKYYFSGLFPAKWIN
ncbi:hypothetical protein Mgra_00010171 [Meloidogyne graminicola]|uniref:Uncharacterized protein n=1 Tax=Meloidogyne graminicola TaxID=189291 RepID=A0A8S9ZCQ2_9BILA|nr:hypothetical protein Mgra_00010202 [Meloidogyne graminicola]KAF7623535.1 hypothetical protein Mgra_00010171 [Meloidogyne graminicola]